MRILLNALLLMVSVPGWAQFAYQCEPYNKPSYISQVQCPQGVPWQRIRTDPYHTGADPMSVQTKTQSTAQPKKDNCTLLYERAVAATNSYLRIGNIASSNASFDAIQSLADFCPSARTCDLISQRVGFAETRHKKIGNSNTSNALNFALRMKVHYCPD
jgi:hypothetical protein